MTTEIAIILLLDGIANGAIYLLAGLGLVLIFSVTRVVFVPFGDITAFCVLSIAAFELGRAARHDLGGRDPGRHRHRHRCRRPCPLRRTRADSAIAAVLWRAAADPLRAGLVRRGACRAPCGADRAGDGAGAADRAAARPHRVPARCGCLGAGAADHRAGAAFRAERPRPDVLRRRRFSYSPGGRRHLRARRRRHRLGAGAADGDHRGPAQPAVLPVLRALDVGPGAARHRRQPHRRAAGRHPAGAHRHAAYFIASLLAGVSAILVGADHDDLLRFRLHDRAEGLHRRHHRRLHQLSDRSAGCGAGRHHGKLCLVLEQFLQGSDRLRPADPGAALAVLENIRTRRRGRRRTRNAAGDRAERAAAPCADRRHRHGAR